MPASSQPRRAVDRLRQVPDFVERRRLRRAVLAQQAVEAGRSPSDGRPRSSLRAPRRRAARLRWRRWSPRASRSRPISASISGVMTSASASRSPRVVRRLQLAELQLRLVDEAAASKPGGQRPGGRGRRGSVPPSPAPRSAARRRPRSAGPASRSRREPCRGRWGRRTAAAAWPARRAASRNRSATTTAEHEQRQHQEAGERLRTGRNATAARRGPGRRRGRRSGPASATCPTGRRRGGGRRRRLAIAAPGCAGMHRLARSARATVAGRGAAPPPAASCSALGAEAARRRTAAAAIGDCRSAANVSAATTRGRRVCQRCVSWLIWRPVSRRSSRRSPRCSATTPAARLWYFDPVEARLFHHRLQRCLVGMHRGSTRRGSGSSRRRRRPAGRAAAAR